MRLTKNNINFAKCQHQVVMGHLHVQRCVSLKTPFVFFINCKVNNSDIYLFDWKGSMYIYIKKCPS